MNSEKNGNGGAVPRSLGGFSSRVRVMMKALPVLQVSKQIKEEHE
jgi:hypothetical protein